MTFWSSIFIIHHSCLSLSISLLVMLLTWFYSIHLVFFWIPKLLVLLFLLFFQLLLLLSPLLVLPLLVLFLYSVFCRVRSSHHLQCHRSLFVAMATQLYIYIYTVQHNIYISFIIWFFFLLCTFVMSGIFDRFLAPHHQPPPSKNNKKISRYLSLMFHRPFPLFLRLLLYFSVSWRPVSLYLVNQYRFICFPFFFFFFFLLLFFF